MELDPILQKAEITEEQIKILSEWTVSQFQIFSIDMGFRKAFMKSMDLIETEPEKFAELLIRMGNFSLCYGMEEIAEPLETAIMSDFGRAMKEYKNKLEASLEMEQ